MAAESGTLSAPVQELSSKVQDLPKNFIYSGGDSESLGVPLPPTDIPIIDFDLLKSSNREELDKLSSCLTSWGCFQAINHGVEAEYLDKVRQVMENFFELPLEKKQKYSRENGSIEGYGQDMIISEQQTLDWTDRLCLTVSPEDQRQLKYWPEDPPTLRELLDDYTKKMAEMAAVLLTAMARSQKLDDNAFIDMCGERPLLIARFNFYPPCPRPEQVVGMKPHTDGSAVTFLLQDKNVAGLQIQKNEQWYSVPIIPHAFVVNIGDLGEIMSNGIFKSPVHRVVTNSDRKRLSLATFSIPDPEKEIEPLEGLVSETRPRKFKKVKDYVGTFFQYFLQGKRPIEAATI